MNATGESYMSMVIRYVFPRLQNLQQDYILKQYGVPPHYSNQVRNDLNNNVSEICIGRGGPAVWP